METPPGTPGSPKAPVRRKKARWIICHWSVRFEWFASFAVYNPFSSSERGLLAPPKHHAFGQGNSQRDGIEDPVHVRAGAPPCCTRLNQLCQLRRPAGAEPVGAAAASTF